MGKITEAKKTDRAAVMACLLAAKNKPEKASLYADSYLEYQEAQKNIAGNGSIVSDPRTGAPVPNPYLVVRDKAFARLESLHKAGVKAGDLY